MLRLLGPSAKMDVPHLIQTEDGQLLWFDPNTETYRIVETLSNELNSVTLPSPIQILQTEEQQEQIQLSCEITASCDLKEKACEAKKATPHGSKVYVEAQQGEQELVSNETSGKNVWDEQQTLLLLEQCKKWKDDINNPRVKKMDVYKKIACEMRKHNHHFTWLQCQNRMKTLLTKYKEIRDHLLTTGNNSRTWAYYDIMLDYIGDRPNVIPTSSLSTLQLQKQSSDSEAGVSPSSTTSDSVVKKKNKKRITHKTSPRNKMLLWLEQHAADMKEKEQKRLEVVERHHQENKELFKQFLEAVNASQKK